MADVNKMLGKDEKKGMGRKRGMFEISITKVPTKARSKTFKKVKLTFHPSLIPREMKIGLPIPGT